MHRPTDLTEEKISGAPFLPEIRRARFQQLTIYEVEESELVLLERGTPDSVMLNVAVALLAAAVSLTGTLLTAEFNSDRTWTIFVVATVVGYVVGLTMLALWRTRRTSVAACAKNIRERLSTEWLDESDPRGLATADRAESRE